ncbi:MAG: hypothetical protein ACRDSP_03895 [Pseudonocardiaceae bacterium]
MSVARFTISYSKVLLPLFVVLGMSPRSSGVEVGPDTVRVWMGWAFSVDIPRSAIRSVDPDTDLVLGWGVHGFGGTWLVNGSSEGLVRLRIDPPVRARVLGIPVRLHTLRLSLAAPDTFLAALRAGSHRT